MDEPQVTLIYHRACSECQLVKEWLDKQNVKHRLRDVFDAPLSREELYVLLEGQDLRPFLNPRSTEYRDRGMAARTPPLDMVVELVARDSRLLRCPILVRGDDVLAVVIPTEALVIPPEVYAFLGIEVAKKPAPHAKAAKPAAAAAGAPAAPAAGAAPSAKAEPPKPPAAPPPAAK